MPRAKKARTKFKLSTEYGPEDDDFVDEIDEDDRMTPEEVEEEIADIYEEFNERKALRTDAFDTFMKIEPKQLIPDEGLYREMRINKPSGGITDCSSTRRNRSGSICTLEANSSGVSPCSSRSWRIT